jgi:hypothetical protein
MESFPTNEAGSLPDWEGDWRGGERPEGYRPGTKRFAKLEKLGFSPTAALGQEFIDRWSELMTRGRGGQLTGEEVKDLLDLNARYHEAMDQFIEENLR